MKAEAIQIVPDDARAGGGHAIIKVAGVFTAPEPATFQIEPLDEDAGEEPGDSWPRGSQSALESRVTDAGLELVIGPDIVDAPDLQPGTPVIVKVPGAGVETELRWPELRLSKAAIPAPVALVKNAWDLAPPPAATPVSSAPKGVVPANENSMPAPTPVGFDTPGTPRPDGPEAASATPSLPGAAAITPMVDMGSGPSSSLSSSIAPRSVADLRKPFFPAEPKKEKPEPEVVAKPSEIDTAQEKPLPAPVAAATVGRGFSAGAVLAMIAVTALLAAGTTALLLPRLERLLPPGSLKPATTDEGQVLTASPAQPDIENALQIAPLSPRGESSEGIDRDEALIRANAYLHGVGKPVDRTEARYWLRVAVVRDLANPQLRWALTQLGSLYATASDGVSADYAMAGLLWEMSGASGDPVALCFLGRLNEFGLGRTADKKKALENYESARRLGGCEGLDAAIARVKG